MERTYIRIESTLLLAVTCYKMDRKEWKNLLQEAVSEAESYHFVRILTKEAGLWLPLLKKSREEKCAAILESIVNGEKTFEEAAKESSTCPSGAQGGDLGEFGKGQMVKEFEDAAFQAEPGHVVGPVKTQFGYHLIKVEKKNEAKEAGFAEVKDPIRAELLKRKQDQAYLAKVKELKEKYVQK